MKNFLFINTLSVILLCLCFALVHAHQQQPLDAIKLQLQWKHQFEFAGFYAAKEKGFYRDAGFEVEFLEYNNNESIVDEVLSNAQYGVTYSSIIAQYLSGKPVVLLASFFKQSPLVLVAQKEITTPAQLKGKKVMGVSDTIDNITLLTMLQKFGVSIDDIENIPPTFNIADFIDKKVDAMSVFTTNELFELEQKKIPYTLFDPTVYGSKYYDLNLFTTRDEVEKYPQRVQNFKDASIKGWEYALTHQEELVDLILEKYNSQNRSREALLFEARQIEQIMLPNVFPVGSIDPHRIKIIADSFIQAGFVREVINSDLDAMIFGYKTELLNLTDAEQEYLKTHKTINVHNESDWPPYNFNRNNRALGFSIDYMRLLGEKIDLNINFTTGYTWDQFLDLIRENKIDVMLNIAKTEERKKFLSYTTPYINGTDVVFTRKGSDSAAFTSLDQFKSRTIAVVKGFYEEELLRKFYPEIELITTDDSLSALKMVSFGKVDGVINNLGTGNYLISSFSLTNIVPSFEIDDTRFNLNLHLATNNSNIILRDILEKGKQRISESELLSLRNKWLTPAGIRENALPLTSIQLEYLSRKKTILMCVDPNWLPFESIEDGQHIGFAADYMDIFSKRIDTPITLVVTESWSESLARVKNRECDILSLAAMTPSREEYLDFTSPYVTVPAVVATKSGVPFVDNLEQILEKKLGVVKDYYLMELLTAKYPDINLIEVQSINDGLEKVEQGDIFGYIDNSIVINYEIQNNYLGTLVISGKFDHEYQLRVATRNDEPLLHDIFEEAVLSVADATRQNLLNEWGNISYRDRVDYSLLWKILFPALIILITSLYWNGKLSRLNKQLTIEKERAVKATESKSEFLSNMSHEIRTPMNGIIGMVHLAMESTSPDESRQYLSNIRYSANALLTIINDILDLSKIEAGKLEVEENDFDLGELIGQVSTLMGLSAKEKGLDFDIVYNKEMPLALHGDSLRISQVLINLINNSIKFTEHGFVQVAISNKGDRYLFAVQDSGIGISDEEIGKLFQVFTQADGSTTRKYGGTGLGLAISKQLVELMNGRIFCESEPSHGSTFSFEIPLQMAHQPMSKKHHEIEKQHETISGTGKTLAGSRILLAEDNKINQMIVTGLLKKSGIRITVTSNGQEAVDEFTAHPDRYQMILMDIKMPVMDGIEATEKIRLLNQAIPIIAITANAMQEDRDQTKKAGFNEHLSKPIEVDELNAVLCKYFSCQGLGA